ncbi:MAG: porin family protein [Myxococcota bacterium]|nr:porin family protein [Myxococcota bacterium]MDW8363325.1 outer membrane beta-barrel protein [Myxococcales bacterium]
MAVLLSPAVSRAQCTGAEIFCASVSIGAPPPPPRAQVVVVQPAPPPPPVVVYRPAPPPPPPAVVVVEPAPQPVVTYDTVYEVAPEDARGLGLHAHLGGMGGERVAMGGIAGAVRWRPDLGHFALDLGMAVYGGEDYQGMRRVEVPFTANLLYFFNPRSRLQLYGLVGLGASFASAESYDGVWDVGGFEPDEARDFAYVGMLGGVGLELRLGRHWAVNGDVRGFVRRRVDDHPEPEFVERDALGRPTGRATDTSGGVVGTLGATLYF